MPFYVALPIAFLLLLSSCWAATLTRKGAHPQPVDFNLGPQASFTALLFVLEMMSSNNGAQVVPPATLNVVGGLSFACFVIATALTRQLHASSLAKKPISTPSRVNITSSTDWPAWGAWTGSNLLGGICVVLVVWLKYSN